MSEGLPIKNYDKFQQQMNAGLELQRQDNEDPERGSVVRRVRAVVSAAYKNHRDSNSPYAELTSFQNSFAEHFGRDEALRYRLYHLIISGSPPQEADLFDFVDAKDAKEKWSIALAMQNLAEKYHIDTEGV